MEKIVFKEHIVYKSNKAPEQKYRKELSELFITELGDGPYSNFNSTRAAIEIGYEYYCSKFIEFCHSIDSLRFYQFILLLHEESIEIAHFNDEEDFPPELSGKYLALYRRILKWTLEQACDIDMNSDEPLDEEYKSRSLERLNELIFLGDMAFAFANMFAEQEMVEDIVEIIFEDDGMYVLQHKHHYDGVIQSINEIYGSQSIKHVVDETATEDLRDAITECFGVDYAIIPTVIQELHKSLEPKGGQYCGFGWESLPLSAESMINCPYDVAEKLFKGLTLSSENKLDLREVIRKPYTPYRIMQRPILIWKVNGKPFAFVGINTFTESIIEISTNSIPWGIAPDEWKTNKKFRKYIHSKEDAHDKWLDDEFENNLNEKEIPFDRNLTSLKSEKSAINLNQPKVGEIDFIVPVEETKTLYVIDCKHLRGRYDLMNQRNDYSNFVKETGYNQQVTNKVEFIKKHKDDVALHFQAKYPDDKFDFSGFTVKGAFVINTTTFYMFNSDIRIYSVSNAVDMILEIETDPILTIVNLEDDQNPFYQVSYPYFRKP
jgi:hypothetical protein